MEKHYLRFFPRGLASKRKLDGKDILKGKRRQKFMLVHEGAWHVRSQRKEATEGERLRT